MNIFVPIPYVHYMISSGFTINSHLLQSYNGKPYPYSTHEYVFSERIPPSTFLTHTDFDWSIPFDICIGPKSRFVVTKINFGSKQSTCIFRCKFEKMSTLDIKNIFCKKTGTKMDLSLDTNKFVLDIQHRGIGINSIKILDTLSKLDLIQDI